AVLDAGDGVVGHAFRACARAWSCMRRASWHGSQIFSLWRWCVLWPVVVPQMSRVGPVLGFRSVPAHTPLSAPMSSAACLHASMRGQVAQIAAAVATRSFRAG